MIKSIPTMYDNTEFRSMLEARWAVFFNVMGIKWEYEPEGFEFNDGTKYLPDFYLPNVDRYVEVKPKVCQLKDRRNIYLAGKVSTDTECEVTSWRNILLDVGEHESWTWSSDAEECAEPKTIYDDNYVGPFYYDMAGGHGCPGSGKHCLEESEECNTKCIEQINNCDVLFAWIDCCNCYGTIAEIGYAIGAGKEVYICAISEEIADEMWFVMNMVDINHRTINKSVLDAFKKFMSPLEWDKGSTRYKDGYGTLNKCKNLANELNTNVSVVYGTPKHDEKYVCIHFDKSDVYDIYRSERRNIIKFGDFSFERLYDAYDAVGKAKFDHGMTPRII